MGRMYRNEDYVIRRENMLAALGLPTKIPVGQTQEWYNVEVRTGRYVPRGQFASHLGKISEGDTTVVLPYVYLAPYGVANRIRVMCPECCREMRFSVLAQHVGSMACKRQVEKNKAAAKALNESGDGESESKPEVVKPEVVKPKRQTIRNWYIKDTGDGRRYMSGLALVRDKDGVTRNIDFVGCDFHPASYGVFENCSIEGKSIPDGKGCLYEYSGQ